MPGTHQEQLFVGGVGVIRAGRVEREMRAQSGGHAGGPLVLRTKIENLWTRKTDQI